MTVDERLNRIESRNRWLQRGLIACCGLLAGVLLMGQAHPRSGVVSATRFVVTGPDGEERAVLGLGADQALVLSLRDFRQREVWAVKVDKRGGLEIVADRVGREAREEPEPDVVEEEIRLAIARFGCKLHHGNVASFLRSKKRMPTDLKEAAQGGFADLFPPPPDGFEDLTDDPWGNPYQLKVEGQGFSIRSFGPDGKKGTADDIVFPVPAGKDGKDGKG